MGTHLTPAMFWVLASGWVQAVNFDTFTAGTGYDQADDFIALLDCFDCRATFVLLVVNVGLAPSDGFGRAKAGDGLQVS
jgi:hypothetical protein